MCLVPLEHQAAGSLNSALRSCRKPKLREAMGKPSGIKPYLLPLARAVCLGLMASKGSM